MVANNVLAHVPDLSDFVRGLATVLERNGVVTIEVPHLLRLVEECQFDTIYHEHLSYFSLASIERTLGSHDLVVVDVEELPTHGGSLRIYATRRDGRDAIARPSVAAMRRREQESGLFDAATFERFAKQIATVKRDLLALLVEERRLGRPVVAYGAAAKGMTLLNCCGIRSDLVDYVVDRNPRKQGRLTPGTRIPIYAPDRILETRPLSVLVLPWNLKHEIVAQLRGTIGFEGRCIIPIPELEILEPEDESFSSSPRYRHRDPIR